jgi:pimeloyl-ACP methyl ester carboxylesterase
MGAAGFEPAGVLFWKRPRAEPPAGGRACWAGSRVGVGEIVDAPVSFKVRNVNRSLVTCLSDGRKYTIRGHLVAPRSTLTAAAPRAVTLYLHGTTVGEPTWRFKAVAGYDYALEQARAGLASVTIDQLGYGASDIPDGDQVCTGSQADIAHQVVGELRSGDYSSPVTRAPSFRRVALAGHSFGGLIAPIEAYSFKDVDALVVADSAVDQPYSPALPQAFARPDGVLATCLRLGDPKRRGAPAGYVSTFPQTTGFFFFNADPRVTQSFDAMFEGDPCGTWDSLLQTTNVSDTLDLGTITIPVLLIFGRQDAIFPPPDGEAQKAMFTRSRDLTLNYIENAGHMVMLQRTAPAFRTAVSDWLHKRGF